MPLNFWKEDADDGTDTAAAIQPIANSEPVEETYLNRTAQNLRARTEDIRSLLDNLQAISRSDRAFAMFAKPTAKIVLDDTGTGDYRISISESGTPGDYDCDLLITPMLSPSKVAATAAAVARFYYQADATPNGLTVDLDAISGHPRKVAEGAHNIYLQIIDDDAISGTPVVEIKANNPAAPDPEDGPVYIIVKIEDGVTTLTEIDSAIDASAAGSLVTASVVGTGSTVVTTGGTPWGPFRAYETDAGDSDAATPYGARAGVDDEGYLIRDTAFNDLFSTRVMKDGDTLFLNFLDAKTRTEHTTGTVFTDASSLEIISSDERLGTDTRNLGDADGPIPLFKVTIAPGSGGVATLVGLNQRAYVIDVPGYVMNSSAEVDDTRTDLAKQTGTPYGDFMVGAEAKTVDALTISAGTVNAQLKDIAKLGEQDGASTSGDNFVGAEAKSGSPNSLARGTVKSQVVELLSDVNALENEYDAHVAGTADNHPLSDVTDKPFVTVGTDGDYTDLATAIETLAAAAGGTIFVEAGLYSINADITSLASSVRIIGQGGYGDQSSSVGVRIQPDTATSPAILVSDTTPTAGLSFENIKFFRNATTNLEIIQCVYGGPTAHLDFRRCYFTNGASSRTTPMVDAGCSVLFEDCTFMANSNTFSYVDSPFFKGYATAGNGENHSIAFNRCTWKYWGELIRLGGSGDTYAGNLIFRDNYIEDCGHADSSAHTPGLLIATESSYYANVDISNNRWPDDASSVTTAEGTFCDIVGTGVIQNNFLTRKVVTDTATVAGYAVIKVQGYPTDGIITAGRISVLNNNITSGLIGCVHSVSGAKVLNNNLEAAPTTLTPVITFGSRTECSGNTIDHNGTSSSLAAMMVDTSDSSVTDVVIANNSISMCGATGAMGVVLDVLGTTYAVRSIVANNVITGTYSASSTGISVGSDSSTRNIIIGNMVYGTDLGISCAGPKTVINGNNITLDSTSGSYGIIFGTSAVGGVCTGNYIYGSNSGDYGIVANSADVAIAGNSVLNVANTITGTAVSAGTSGIGTGTSRDITHNLY